MVGSGGEQGGDGGFRGLAERIAASALATSSASYGAIRSCRYAASRR